MKMSLLSLSAGIAIVWGATALADDQKIQPLSEVHSAKSMMSHEVRNSANEKLGKIEDLAIDKDGQCRFLIVGVGGIVNSDKFIAIPCSAVKPDHQNKQCTLEMSKTNFEAAPSYTREQYYSAWPKEWRTKVNEHFGVKSELTKEETKSDSTAQAEQDKNRTTSDDSTLFYATKLLGANLRNRNNDTLTSIDDLAMNGKGCVKYAIVGHGGVLKIGENKIAVPWKAMDLTLGEKGTVMASIDMTGKQLEGAPVLKQENMADLMSESYVQSSNRFFGVTERKEVEAKTPAERDRQRKDQDR